MYSHTNFAQVQNALTSEFIEQLITAEHQTVEVTGVLRPHAEYIDALVTLTIALIGAENIVVQTQRPRLVALGEGGSLVLMAPLQWLGFGGLPSLLLLGAGLFTANYLLMSGHLRDAGRLRILITLQGISRSLVGV